MSQTDEVYDCVILGAGPAGLTALTYLARFHRRVVALGGEGARPRLLLIDRTYNLPGYPDGVSGQVLLDQLREQAEECGGVVRAERAVRVDACEGELEQKSVATDEAGQSVTPGGAGPSPFAVTLENGDVLRARTVLLAMGVVDRQPDIPGVEPHVGKFVRYCPVCDGFEHTGEALGILGSGPSVARHALFLRTFSDRITVFTHGERRASLGKYEPVLEAHGIPVMESPIVAILEGTDDSPRDYAGTGVRLEDGSEHTLCILYGALGCDVNVQPVQHLPVKRDSDGYVITDVNGETSVTGMYAAGDLDSDINQISVAFGQAAVAAVRIHNALDAVP